MTTPVDGRFVTSNDVAARFKGGVLPANRATTVKWRILDVENELFGLVPSLQTLDPGTTDPAAKVRVGRVRTLIIDKVLDLVFFNPEGASSKTQAMDGISTTLGGLRPRDAGSGVSFTEAELDRVRLRKVRRPKVGTYGAKPWMVS